MNVRSDPSSCSRRWATIARPFCHVVITVKATRPMSERQPGAVADLRQVRGEEQHLDRQDRPAAGDHEASAGTLQRRAGHVERNSSVVIVIVAVTPGAVGEREGDRALERRGPA